MKDKKGFTLTELLAIIVIICILLAIAIPIYRKIKNESLNQSYNNVVSTIEVAAEKYAADTGVEITNVDQLVKTGYLPADDENGNIYDPRDNSILNCYEIDITNNGNDDYNAALTENKTNSDKTCDLTNINISDAIVVSCEDDGISCGPTNNWYNGAIKLSVDLNKIGLTNTDNITYAWTSNTGYKSTNSIIHINSNVNIMNTMYTVIIKKTDANNNVTSYKATKLIKMDNESPKILNIEKESDGSAWISEEKIIINGTDGFGSGINGYALIKGENIDCKTATLNTSTPVNKFTITENGKYSYCIIDNVGNIINSNNSIDVENIDKLPSDVTITTSDNIASGSNHSTYFNLLFEVSNKEQSCTAVGDDPCGNITYYLGLSENDMTKSESPYGVTPTLDGKVIYIKACNRANKCSNTSMYKVNFAPASVTNYNPPTTVKQVSSSTASSGCTASSSSTECMQERSNSWWDLQAIVNSSTATKAEKTEAQTAQSNLTTTNSKVSSSNTTCASHGGCTLDTTTGEYKFNDGTGSLYTKSDLTSAPTTSSSSTGSSTGGSTGGTSGSTTTKVGIDSNGNGTTYVHNPDGTVKIVEVTNGHAPSGLEKGAVIVTGGGNFEIIGTNKDGSYITKKK
jgi:type IV pilus assembly protein PilA